MSTPTPTQPVSARAHAFINSVLDLKPQLAVFDCDGTLWEGDSGKDFLYWEIDHKLITGKVAEWVIPRYASYKQGLVDEFTMCAEMTTLHEGLPVAAIEIAAAKFFPEMVEHRIFAEMQELTRRLIEQGCELWAVSSTNEWSIREGVKRFGIPGGHVLAGQVEIVDGIASGKLLRLPTDESKATAIRDVINRVPDCVFGNSIHDAAMMEMARTAFAINPNPDLEAAAQERGWTIYHPDALRK